MRAKRISRACDSCSEAQVHLYRQTHNFPVPYFTISPGSRSLLSARESFLHWKIQKSLSCLASVGSQKHRPAPRPPTWENFDFTVQLVKLILLALFVHLSTCTPMSAGYKCRKRWRWRETNNHKPKMKSEKLVGYCEVRTEKTYIGKLRQRDLLHNKSPLQILECIMLTRINHRRLSYIHVNEFFLFRREQK